MIQGHIDFASRTRVEGWIYSAAVSLIGTKILAFVREQCVGSGMVEVFRQDVAEAGFGDGLAGFSFSIYLEPEHDPRVIDVRLDSGNVLLKQDAACLIPRSEVDLERRPNCWHAQSLSLMLSRRWINQEQYDALRLLGLLGVYKRTLGLTSKVGDVQGSPENVASIAAGLLEIQNFELVQVEQIDSYGADHLKQLRGIVRRDFPLSPPVVGLWSTNHCTISVTEGSHLWAQATSGAGGIDYEFGDNSFLLVNLDCEISIPVGGLRRRLMAFVPRATAA